jgi:hypothetical protein
MFRESAQHHLQEKLPYRILRFASRRFRSAPFGFDRRRSPGDKAVRGTLCFSALESLLLRINFFLILK